MEKCSFIQLTQGVRQDLCDYVISYCVDLFRGDHFKRIFILISDKEEANLLSKRLWQVDGFIPSVLQGSEEQELSPIILGDSFDPKCEILINLQLNKTQYSNEELRATHILDFILSSDQNSVASCRQRYKQLKQACTDFEFKKC